MPSRLPTARSAADACPGVLRPHSAADGELVRVRTPGGALTSSSLRALRRLSERFGDGRVGLTSRANVQLRGLSSASLPAVADGLRATGLLPGALHERVRNIIASPLSGRGPGGFDDIDDLVRALDAGLLARPQLAALPGRFLFTVDDGSQDLADVAADVALVALGAGRVRLHLAGRGVGRTAGRAVEVPRGEAVRAALAIAEAFLAERSEQGSGTAWRIAEVGADAVLARLPPHPPTVIMRKTAVGPLSGLVEQQDGRLALAAVAPLGLLEPEQAEALAAAADLADSSVRVTPWRRVVVRDLDLPAALAARELLAATGLITEPGTGWERLTACAGRPGCARSLADVHADARAMVAELAPAGPALHLVGCERACGAPAGATRLIATGAGYREVEP